MEVTKFYLPVNLNVEEIRSQFRAEYAEKLLFFISSIYFRRVTNKTFEETDFIPLKAQVLGKFMRFCNVRPVKEELMARGIIETDDRYIVGKKSIGFRLTEKYRGEKTIAVPARFKKKIKEEISDMSENDRYLKANLQTLSIDEAALAEISETQRESIGSYNFAFVSYHLIRDSNFFWSKDRKTGRVFNNACNCPREMRKHFRLDGKPVVESDISNCQPMLLYFLYVDKTSEEAIRYKAIVENGSFYEIILDKTGQSRETTKKRFMSFAFGELHFENKVSKAFAILFPELMATIAGLKAGDYKALAMTLQKLEADLIINAVVPLCAQKGIKCLTVHDSILTHAEHAEEVREMIQAECQRIYEVMPNVSQKAESTGNLPLAA